MSRIKLGYQFIYFYSMGVYHIQAIRNNKLKYIEKFKFDRYTYMYHMCANKIHDLLWKPWRNSPQYHQAPTLRRHPCVCVISVQLTFLWLFMVKALGKMVVISWINWDINVCMDYVFLIMKEMYCRTIKWKRLSPLSIQS